jgi:type II pantothenate kinase
MSFCEAKAFGRKGTLARTGKLMPHMAASKSRSSVRIGVDVGSSLTKLAYRGGSGPVRYELLGRAAYDHVVEAVNRLQPQILGLTGGGASQLASRLGGRAVEVNEFTAWGTGANHLLRGRQKTDTYLLVSLGTGTSVMLVDHQQVRRLGGTALGGGTILGLGAALLQQTSFEETCHLAAQGTRDSVDLLVRDIYSDPDRPLKGDLTAASFGRLARQDSAAPPREDIAAAIMRLVGENVTLIAGGHARHLGLDRLVFGGSTLRNNPALEKVLNEVSALLGLKAYFLTNGEFAGALGALTSPPDREGL